MLAPLVHGADTWCFVCGPDSLVTELCSRTISEPPLITVVLDELQSEAGLRTRLESFVDIVRMHRDSRAAEEVIEAAEKMKAQG